MKMIHLLICCLIVSSSIAASSTIDHQRKVFIAYMGHLPEDDQYSPSLHHSEIINQIIDPTYILELFFLHHSEIINQLTDPTYILELFFLHHFEIINQIIDIDRRLVDMVRLGDGSVLVGTSINAFPSSEGESPLIYGEEVTNNCTETDAKNCYKGCVESSRVHQKVVICNMNGSIEAVTAAGALGCIVPNGGKQFSEVMPIPVAALSENDTVINYKTSTKNPEVKIFKSEAIRNPAAPLVASSSSRGPIEHVNA